MMKTKVTYSPKQMIVSAVVAVASMLGGMSVFAEVPAPSCPWVDGGGVVKMGYYIRFVNEESGCNYKLQFWNTTRATGGNETEGNTGGKLDAACGDSVKVEIQDDRWEAIPGSSFQLDARYNPIDGWFVKEDCINSSKGFEPAQPSCTPYWCQGSKCYPVNSSSQK